MDAHPKAHSKGLMEVHTIPVLDDNYSYLIVDAKSRVAAAVDPADARRVSEFAAKHNAKIEAVLTTHHHGDHAGGNPDMVKMHSGITVYGGEERVAAVTKIVKHKETLKIGSINVTVLASPCHTSGHVLYVTSTGEEADDAIFTGDTLFVGGCGRFFEGTAAQMYQNLRAIADLKAHTKVYCGHEYTVKNMKFALTIEPDNADYKAALAKAEAQRARGEPTVPSTVEAERRINVFMRSKEPSVAAALDITGADPITVLAELRTRKDKY